MVILQPTVIGVAIELQAAALAGAIAGLVCHPAAAPDRRVPAISDTGLAAFAQMAALVDHRAT